MQTTRYARLIAVAGLVVFPAIAKHPEPEYIHLKHKSGASAATPGGENVMFFRHGDDTQTINFQKDNNGRIYITFLKPDSDDEGLSPCNERHPQANAGSPAVCHLKPAALACQRDAAHQWDSKNDWCVFRYKTDNDDPEIEIEPGYGSGPPPAGGGKKSPAKKK